MSPVLYCYISMVRPHVEYANSVWCPYKQGDIKLQRTWKKFKKELLTTKLVINLKKMPYKDRLMHLNLPTLKKQAITWRYDRGI